MAGGQLAVARRGTDTLWAQPTVVLSGTIRDSVSGAGIAGGRITLVGTDLTQAIPLVGAAALGHVLFGQFNAAITISLLLGAIPGAFIGAQISSRAPGGIIRRALAVLLLASGLRLLGLGTELVLLAAVSALVVGSLAWIVIRRAVKRRRRASAAPS